MPECPICRRSYDGRFQVFVPPHYEAFDTVACARRAAEVGGWDKAAPVPVILPTIEVVGARSETHVASAAPRRGIAALGVLVVAPGQAALAAGVGLLAAGTAASIYLWATRPPVSSPLVVGVPHTRQPAGPGSGATGPSLTGRPPAATRPAAGGSPRTTTPPPATGSVRSRPPTKATHAVQIGPKSAAQAQYGTYHPPFSSSSASPSSAGRSG